MAYRPLVAASQPLFDDECPQRDSRRMRRVPVVYKLLRVRSLHRVPGNQARQFDPFIFRIQFPERKNKVLECQLSLLLVHPPSLLCKLFVGSSRFSLHLYDTIQAVQMLVFLCFGGCGADTKYDFTNSFSAYFSLNKCFNTRDTIAVGSWRNPFLRCGGKPTVLVACSVS